MRKAAILRVITKQESSMNGAWRESPEGATHLSPGQRPGYLSSVSSSPEWATQKSSFIMTQRITSGTLRMNPTQARAWQRHATTKPGVAERTPWVTDQQSNNPVGIAQCRPTPPAPCPTAGKPPGRIFLWNPDGVLSRLTQCPGVRSATPGFAVKRLRRFLTLNATTPALHRTRRLRSAGDINDTGNPSSYERRRIGKGWQARMNHRET